MVSHSPHTLLFTKPFVGDFRTLLDSWFSVEENSILEYLVYFFRMLRFDLSFLSSINL